MPEYFKRLSEEVKPENTHSETEAEYLGMKEEEIEEQQKNYGEVFDSYKKGRDRAKEILSRIEVFLSSPLINGDEVRKDLEQCSEIENREEFIKRAFTAIKPIILLRKNNREAFNMLANESHKLSWVKNRERFRALGRIEINDAVAYDMGNSKLNIHLAPIGDYGIGKIRRLFLDGLTTLKEIIRENEEIKEIVAISWIVTEHPKILEKLGFTMGEKVDEQQTKATITRADFLNSKIF